MLRCEPCDTCELFFRKYFYFILFYKEFSSKMCHIYRKRIG